jgi:hypothetical protein
VPSHNGTAVTKQVASLFAGVRDSTDVTGLVWFDYVQKSPAENWDLADDPATLAAFRAATAGGTGLETSASTTASPEAK